MSGCFLKTFPGTLLIQLRKHPGNREVIEIHVEINRDKAEACELLKICIGVGVSVIGIFQDFAIEAAVNSALERRSFCDSALWDKWPSAQTQNPFKMIDSLGGPAHRFQ